MGTGLLKWKFALLSDEEKAEVKSLYYKNEISQIAIIHNKKRLSNEKLCCDYNNYVKQQVYLAIQKGVI